MKPDLSAALGHTAEEYVKLALALGAHDANYVDAYYGPASWKTDAAQSPVSLGTIQTRASTLVSGLRRLDVAGSEELLQLRRRFLGKQLQSMMARAEILAGKEMKSDEESARYEKFSGRASKKREKKTKEHISLPAHENFQIEYVTGQV